MTFTPTPQRMRAILGGPFSRLSELPITDKLLSDIGKCMVKALSEEAMEYFAKRGWSGRDPMGGAPIWESFSYRIRGKRTVEIVSTFYGMDVLAHGDIPERKMTWLTQEAKDRHPGKYDLTDGEKDRKMKKTGRVSKGQRLPLVVPIKSRGGAIVLMRAPLTIGDAWVHPGVAKFTFFETAVRKWRKRCAGILAQAVVAAIAETQR